MNKPTIKDTAEALRKKTYKKAYDNAFKKDSHWEEVIALFVLYGIPVICAFAFGIVFLMTIGSCP